ncbi:MarR family transcriptional regulator [Anoxybacterium hadale]|uniref:MarR family transcriptional regulator n=1 Tax=Anoxybacterium hadale TaxID=3408580 RepID=A0ACD1AH64_9FIRM|nr:MarR family transcriptional regulator [Clostridiales bacterium]
MNQESFGRYISSIYRHLLILISHELREYGIGSGQYIFFGEIARNEGISQKDLSKLIQIDKATTVKAIKKLEEEGYIYRVQDSADKRYNFLFLTEKGKDFLPVFKERMSNITTILSKGMTEEQRSNTIETLAFMLKNTIDAVDELKSNA